MYELALRSAAWHQVEHACFFIVALIFWWPIVQPWPSRAHFDRWTMVPYLLLADVQNTALCAILIFSDRVLYPSYALMPRLLGSALEDQAAAGAMMWVVGSLAFVLPAVAIAVECLSTKASPAKGVPDDPSQIARPASPRLAPPQILIRSRPQPRSGARGVEVTSFLVLFVVIGSCLAALASSHPSDDDDQALRFERQSGPFLVAVFGQPGDLSPGRANFGILVQDRETHDVWLDAIVDFRVVADADTPGSAPTARAVPAQAENKLLQTAELNLPNEGNWKIYLSVQRNSEAADFVLPLHVVKQPTAPEHVSLWPYIVLVAFGAILLMVYVQRHRESPSARVENPETTFTGSSSF
jgi:hypothetical protein